MDGYLLDNNVVSRLAWRDPHIVEHFEALGDAYVYLPVMAVAEIEEGLRRVDNPNEEQRNQQDQLRMFLRSFQILPFDDNTIPYYAYLRAELWRLKGTRRSRGYAETVPEQLTDRVTGQTLGIDERDLIIASVAIEHNLILATADRNNGMKTIQLAAQSLAQKGEGDCNLLLADWLVPLGPSEDAI